MGLYAYFDVASCGLPEEVTASDVGYPEMEDMVDSVEISYEGPLSHMVSTFLDIATTIVPVDTGYLKSTIHAETDGTTYAEFFADAEYAQYVEYGTWRMRAQPYFQPALDQALEVFITEAMQAYTEVAQQMEQFVQDMMSAAMEAATSMMGPPFGGFPQMSTGAYLGGLALGLGMMILAFPLLVNLYGIMDTIMGPSDPTQDRINNLQMNGIDVIIT